MAEQTVLICDDNDHYRGALKASLESFGFRVFSTSDAKAAVRVANSEHLDLVVLDVFMPKEDGISLARRLNRKYPKLPIVVCSGQAQVFQSLSVTMGLQFVAGVFPKSIGLDDLRSLIFDVLNDDDLSR